MLTLGLLRAATRILTGQVSRPFVGWACAAGALPSVTLTFREHTLALIWNVGRWGACSPGPGLRPLQGLRPLFTFVSIAPVPSPSCRQARREGGDSPAAVWGPLSIKGHLGPWSQTSSSAVLGTSGSCPGSRAVWSLWLGQMLNTGSWVALPGSWVLVEG